MEHRAPPWAGSVATNFLSPNRPKNLFGSGFEAKLANKELFIPMIFEKGEEMPKTQSRGVNPPSFHGSFSFAGCQIGIFSDFCASRVRRSSCPHIQYMGILNTFSLTRPCRVGYFRSSVHPSNRPISAASLVVRRGIPCGHRFDREGFSPCGRCAFRAGLVGT